MKKNICKALLLLLGAFISCASFAQSLPDATGAEAAGPADTLRQSTVTAYSSRSSTPSQTLSGEDLHRLSSQSVADALRYFSGVQIKDYGGIGGLKTVNVRSLGAQHVGIFYDGISITNAQNGQVDLGRYSLDNMEAVSVYNAQKSETLQSAGEYASGSTVYLRTKVPVFDGKPYNVLARLKYGSFGTFSPILRYEQKIGRSAISAEGMYLQTKGDYRFSIKNSLEDTTARRSNGDVQAGRMELGLWSHPLGGDLQAHAYFYSSERGLPGPVVRRLSDQYSSKDRQWDRDMFMQASWKRSFRKVSVLANAKGSYDRLEYLSDPAENSAAIYTHNTYKQRNLFASVAAAWHPADWLSLNFAADERWADLRCDVAYFSYVQRYDTKAVAAVTMAYDGFLLQASMLGTRIEDVSDGASKPLGKLSPTITGRWSSKDGIFTARAFYKDIFRAPTLNDLYYTFVGNANLNPEKARQTDIGFDLQTPSSSSFQSKLSADFYISRITDKIVAMPGQSQFRWTMMNFGKVHGCGAELSWKGSAKIGKCEVSSMLTYSYEEARDRSNPESISYGGQIPYTPWHSGSAILGIRRGPWNANMSFLYTGRRYRSADNTADNRLRPWQTADLSLEREFCLKGETRLTAGIDICNIFNQQYEVVTRYPMPGTNALCKISISF